MDDHYYSVNPSSEHQYFEFEAQVFDDVLRFTTDAGVFSRDGVDTGTRVLLKALPPLKGRVLDLGCGWGAVGVALGKQYPLLQILMTDINNRAVELSRMNLKKNGVSAEVIQGDAFENVAGTFDVILTNPPIRAGKAVIYGMFETARQYLNDGGSLYIVIRKQQGAPSALKFLAEKYSSAEMIDRDAGFWVIRAEK